MTAGRELDALVHAKVMGHPEQCWHPNAEKVDPKHTTLIRCPDCGETFGDSTYVLALSTLPRYSTDIAAAWSVVEKMRGEGVYIDVQPRCDRWDTVAGWQGPDDGDIWEQVSLTADTAPLAICLAALRAKGVDV